MILSSSTYKTASDINTAMSRVYLNMMLAVLTSMLVAMFVASSPALMNFFFTGIMRWVVIFAPLVAIIAISILLNTTDSKSVAWLCLLGFSALMGLSFSAIFVVYTTASIVSAFMSGAVLFAVLSFYGYFTKRSLDSWWQFLFIGLIAVIIASIVNVFVGSSVLTMVVSACAIIVFLGLTAYDTQKIREMISTDQIGIVEVRGALTLYMDFINIFLSILQLFGNKE
jgi:FtsH-binding integral membrane protein